MNAFRGHTGYLTEGSFDSLSGIDDQKVFPWLMGTFGIAFSGTHHFNTFCLCTNLLIVVINMSTIATNSAFLRQVKEHVFIQSISWLHPGSLVNSTSIPSTFVIT